MDTVQFRLIALPRYYPGPALHPARQSLTRGSPFLPRQARHAHAASAQACTSASFSIFTPFSRWRPGPSPSGRPGAGPTRWHSSPGGSSGRGEAVAAMDRQSGSGSGGAGAFPPRRDRLPRPMAGGDPLPEATGAAAQSATVEGGDGRAPLLPSELAVGLAHRCCAIHRDQWAYHRES